MTAIKRGIHFCYQKHFLFFCQVARPFARILVCCFALGVLFWPKLGLKTCAGLSLAFRNLLGWVVRLYCRTVVFWHGFFFLFAELVQSKKHWTFTLREHYVVDSTTQNTPLVGTLPTHPGTLPILYHASNNLYTAFVDGVDHVSSPVGLDGS